MWVQVLPSLPKYYGVFMSRSYRKTPVYGFSCSVSEADDKHRWHKLMRTVEKQKLNKIPLYKTYTSDRDPVLEEYLDDVFGHCSCSICNHYDKYDHGGYDHITTVKKDVSNLWDMSKDGKYYMTKDRLLRYINYPFNYLNVDPMRRYYRLVSK